ncbi:MAG: nicotianamine synthase [Deltaproteobacteria bacterium]|nr:MAG: nicotianamine synthase [Deltaproteobacteria bacterium]
MHDINFTHEHELKEHDFLGCCKDCQASLDIIKPHIMGFAKRIKKYTPKMLAALKPADLYRLYQLIDDLAHMETGAHLAGLILDEADIRRELPVIRSYYSAFFNIHEKHLAEELCKSKEPWDTLKSFPFYPRYEALVRNQIEAVHPAPGSRLAFIGCGSVPMTLILMSRLYGIRSIGLDNSAKTVNLSKKVIQCLGLEKQIEIIQGDESGLQDSDWDLALVAALAEPKARIFQTLRKILKERKELIPVIFRTYTGMRAVLYKPVQPEDIQGFSIVKQILPTGRVNNTTVFAELDE